MKTQEFNENYELENGSGLKARKRNLPKQPPVYATANGEPFDQNRTYYFFDEQSKAIRTNQGLRPNDEGFLTAMAWKVIEIKKLHTDKDNAVRDGQEFYKQAITDAREKIQKLETQKSPANRSLKQILISRDL
jgi:hypothetical protein